MKRVFTILFAAMLAGQAWAQSTYDFSAVCSTGQTLFFKRLDNQHLRVTHQTNVTLSGTPWYSGSAPKGNLVIPETVEYEGVNYTVTAISSMAFENCTGLDSVTIPNSVTIISDGSFKGCDNLTEIYVQSDNAKYTSENGILFSKDKKTLMRYPAGKKESSYSIPNTVTEICTSAFNDCFNLTSVTIPNSVTSIGNDAFYCCKNLTSIILPDGITSIKKGTFYYCTKLKSITISESIKSIGERAFYGSGLISISIPQSVTSIGDYAFGGCSKLSEIYVESANTNYESQDGVLFNKTTIICYPANKIETAYTIPKSVTNIGNYAFDNCINLTSVTIPNSVTSIGKYAFDDCINLASITIPNSVTSIDYCAFSYCNNLKQITSYATYDDGLPTLGDYAFSSNPCTVIIPCGQTDYYKESDWGKYSNFTYVEDYLNVFTVEANNPGMGSVEILKMPDCSNPATVKATANDGYVFVMWDDGRSAFEIDVDVYGDRHCTAYFAPADADINIIPKNDAFWYYNSETKMLHIGGHGELAIYSDYKWGDLPTDEVEHVFMEDGFTYIDASTFQNFKALKDVRLPATLKKVGSTAFNGCESLESVVIPEGVREIEYGAFNGCSSMKYVVLPSTLQKMWSRAFGSCSMLDSIVVKCDTAIDLPSMVFYGGSINTKFYIPCGKKELYTSKECWTINVTSNDNFVETMVYDLSVASSDSKRGTAEIVEMPDCGTAAVVKATAKPNYQFLKWSDGSTANPYEFALKKDMALTAIFVGKQSGITVKADTNGDVYVPLHAYFKDSVTVTATPSLGYEVDIITVTSGSDKLELKNNKFMMPLSDVCVTVKFKPVDYKIIVNIKNGKITIPETAHYGDTVKFEIEWNKGAKTWTAKKRVDDADGKMILGTNNNQNYFVMPACNVTMTVSVEMEEYEIEVRGLKGKISIENGKITVPKKAYCGDTVQFKIIPNEGYVCSLVKLWIYRNDRIDEELTLTNETSFVMPYCESVCLCVEFVEDDGTPVTETAANAVNIYAYGNTIVVENATEEISVYDAMGRVIARKGRDVARNVSTGTTSIPVNAPGIYVVKTGSTVKRVMVN